MSHLSFYRKWRPQTFEEVIGQERVTRTLQNAIRTGRVVHAYLFAGHRGTGKTTTARILAKALNCLQGPTPTPDNTCPNCQAIAGGYSVDVIEIDAASNRGIEEIRELRDRIRLAPTEGRKKVYIIDEAHMLTPEAANALLKTLEEPPEHAVLVLVTTEPHRLPATILSRCQRFDFRRVSQKEIIARLRHIAATEGFAIDDPALALIVAAADGSVRDAESILDQLAAFAQGPITAADVQALLGLLPEDVSLRLADAIVAHDAPAALELVGQVINEGKDVRQVLRTLLDHFRDLLVLRTGGRGEVLDTTEGRLQALQAQAGRIDLPEILRALNVLSAADAEARWSPQPRLALEVALIRLCRPEMDPTLEGLRTRLYALEERLGTAPGTPPPARQTPATPPLPLPEREPAAEQPSRAAERPSRAPRRPPSEGPQNAATAPPPAAAPASVGAAVASPPGVAPEPPVPAVGIEDVRRSWARILEEVKRTKMFCHALLIEGVPLAVEDDHLVIGLRQGYNFHRDNLHRPENRSVVEGAVERVLRHHLRLRCTVLDDAAPPAPTGPAITVQSDPLVARAVELFGGHVVEIKDA
ncbi:MAG: DNA polymerase III subunit gamma/tau [Armatimonadota bacterium]|nr:DNA polymerase III subunit gamma/tau [Armatimonadota bacterium]MDR7451001.1 DNA polymerase III subunit gamma/tau [Armatimonadota bacterium]MDR7465978.1 DNA polymerase III subunit gamma/tau [Armatimonadota bacterium]MDR7494043.1 DNA polymerase III subunit gamma/tau [Armatimonadota bacterium]MDR7498493.1 DNA polymerase III subunit gamma/tau [Armatimonadota bacterium]